MSRHLAMFTDTHFTLIGFVIFFVLFLLLVVSTGLPSERAKFKRLERLPLDGENGKDLA